MGTQLTHRLTWQPLFVPSLFGRWARPLARRYCNRALVVTAEAVLAILSYGITVFLLAEQQVASWPMQVLSRTLPLLLFIRLASYFLFGLWKRSFRYASVPDLICVVKAVLPGSVVFFLVARLGLFDVHLPRAFFLLDSMTLLCLLGALHFGLRVYQTQLASHRKDGRRFLVVGAGDAASSVVRELVVDPDSPGRPVAIVDDDPTKLGSSIGGVTVRGALRDLPRLVRLLHIDEVIICIPSATRSQMRRIFALCRQARVPLRTLPSLAQLVDGSASRRNLREVRVEDLLEREEFPPDQDITRRVVSDRVVLVTGAGGTIGSELCRQIAAAHPQKLLVVEKSENSLFYAHLELRERFPEVAAEPILLDVTRREAVRELFARERPEVVFHAAAYKHVQLMELHPLEAIRNNVLGSHNVACAADEFRSSRFINISTDKAVHPRNYMGLSKKITELCIQHLSRTSATRFMNVRFGNVVGSTGSVLRLFGDQIRKGGPILVTDPRATRFFMTRSEAVSLVLHAAAQGRGGETFVLDMGEPLNIYELACALSLLNGLAPEKDVPIQIVGLRDGEKLTEQLWESWEAPRPTSHSRIRVIRANDPLARHIMDHIRVLEQKIAAESSGEMLACLQRIFPAFRTPPPELPPSPNGDLHPLQSVVEEVHP